MGSAAITADTAWQRPAVNPWIIALTVTLATFMEVLDTSVANVALPHIAGGLSARQDESTWILTSYLVSNAIVLPMSGWFSQLIGRKRFYMSCVALFTISSFLCGLGSQPRDTDYSSACCKASGAAGCSPASRRFWRIRLNRESAAWLLRFMAWPWCWRRRSVPRWAVGSPTTFNWRWIFFINIPVGVVSLLLTNLLISDPPYMKQGNRKGFRIDYIGLGLLALGLGTLQVVLDKGQRDDWFGSNFILTMTIISVVALVAVCFWEWYHKDPIIDLHLFKDRSFAAGNLMMFMVGFALLSSTVLIPQYVQQLMGYTAEQAGLALMPGGFAIILCMPLVGYLLGHTDARRLLFFGFVVLFFALIHMTSFDTSVDFRTIATARVYPGAGARVSFCAHQYGGIRIFAAGEK